MAQDQETVITLCYGCRTAFDVSAVAWCDCEDGDRTLVCPGCGICFCAAPKGYIDGFWLSAPDSLWWRRNKMREVSDGG